MTITPHVTVPDQSPFISYTVTSAEDEYRIEWTLFDKTDLRVVVGGRELAQNEFEITGDGGYEGGYPGATVTLDVAVSNTTVRIWSEMPPVRINDFTEGGGFPARALNTELDRATARLRDMRLRMQRTPTLARSTSGALTVAQAGQMWTNEGASGTLAYTLPQASAGLTFSFAVVVAQTLQILSFSGDTIYDATSSGDTLSASAIGCIIELKGTNEDTWLVASKNGTWAVS
jgi:hypothetical protein